MMGQCWQRVSWSGTGRCWDNTMGVKLWVVGLSFLWARKEGQPLWAESRARLWMLILKVLGTCVKIFFKNNWNVPSANRAGPVEDWLAEAFSWTPAAPVPLLQEKENHIGTRMPCALHRQQSPLIVTNGLTQSRTTHVYISCVHTWSYLIFTTPLHNWCYYTRFKVGYLAQLSYSSIRIHSKSAYFNTHPLNHCTTLPDHFRLFSYDKWDQTV